MLYASESSAQVLGYPPHELVGKSVFDLIHQEDRNRFSRAFHHIIGAPASGPVRVEVRICTRDWQWLNVESTLFNLSRRQNSQAISICHRAILSELGSNGEKQSSQRAEPQVTRSTADFEDLAVMLAHDLREPLRAISVFTEMLALGPMDDPERQRLTRFVREGVGRMSALLDGLSSIAIARDQDVARPFKLESAVTDALHNLTLAITESGAVVTVGALPEVRGNDVQFTRVFQNVIANAIKYRSSESIRIRVYAEALGPGWVIKISDNGIGIAPEHHESVFRLLKRLHGADIPGSGIGLAVCKTIVESQGGLIWLESALGVGTTLCFTILGGWRMST